MLEPGIYENISAEEYHSDPCDRPSLSSSIAKILITQSPAHAWLAHPKLGGQPFAPSDDMDAGTIGHAILLKQNRKISVIRHKDYRTAEARALRKSAREQGAVPILEARLAEVNESASAIRDRLRMKYGIELSGKSEVVIVWDETADDGTRVRCRGQIDHLILPLILDFKMTADASPDAVSSRVSQLEYMIQGSAYPSAIEKLLPEWAGRVTFELFNCEPFKPFAVTRADFAGTMKELGQMKWRRSINTWARCLKTNHWPDYPAETLHVEAKPWHLERELERAYASNL